MTYLMKKTSILRNIYFLEVNNYLKSSFYILKDHCQILEMLEARNKYKVSKVNQRKKLEKISSTDSLIIPPTLTSPTKVSFELNIINQFIDQGCRIFALCGGVYYLATMGLLDNKYATTHFFFEKDFKIMFPKIKFDCSKISITHKKVTTLGGIYSILDMLCILVLKDEGRAFAAKYNLFCVGHGIRKEQIKNFDSIKNSSKIKILFSGHELPITLEDLANGMGMSIRTAQRYLRKEFNETFRELYDQYRAMLIEEYLAQGLRLQEIAYKIGINDESAFSQFFKKMFKTSYSNYKEQYLLNL